MDDIPGLAWIIPKKNSDYDNSFVVAIGSIYDTVVGPYSENE